MIKKQRGYLLIITLLLITTVGVICRIILDIHTTHTGTMVNIIQADQALAIAKSAIEIGKAHLNAFPNTTAITSLNHCYPHIPLLTANLPGNANDLSCQQGTYDLRENCFNTQTTLVNTINRTQTTIQVTASDQLAKSGVITIDQENIFYQRIDRNGNLHGVKRGFADTTATTHNANSVVKQNFCAIHATGYLPNKRNPEGEKQIDAFIVRQGDLGKNPYLTNVPLLCAGSLTIQNTGDIRVANDQSRLLDDGSYSLATVLTGGAINSSFDSKLSTYTTPAQELTSWTNNGSLQNAGDIRQYNNEISNPNTIWDLFFDFERPDSSTLQNGNYYHDYYISCSKASGQDCYLSGIIADIERLRQQRGDNSMIKIIVPGNLRRDGNDKVPRTLDNVSLLIFGNFFNDDQPLLTINGLLYLANNRYYQSLFSARNFSLNGSLISEGNVTINNSRDTPVYINYNQGYTHATRNLSFLIENLD